MTDDFREQVYATLNLKETDELVEIWRTNNRMDWSEIAFESIHKTSMPTPLSAQHSTPTVNPTGVPNPPTPSGTLNP